MNAQDGIRASNLIAGLLSPLNRTGRRNEGGARALHSFTLRSYSGRYLHSFAISIHLSMSDILDSHCKKIVIAPP